MRKKIVFIVVLMILGLLTYNYLYQDHRDISSETPDFIDDAQNITSQFMTEPIKSQEVYNDKTIQVTGIITELNTTDITLDNVIFCQFNEVLSTELSIGSTIEIKGRCIGFDDLLEQVKLNECTLISK